MVITIPSLSGLGIYAAVDDEVSTNALTVDCCEAASRMFTVALIAFGITTLGSGFIDKSAAYKILGSQACRLILRDVNVQHG